MLLLKSWLKDYIELNISDEQLANDLSLKSLNVESIQKIDNDILFELEITPNRSDCLSVLGVAREVAAIENINLKNIPTKNVQISQINEKIDLKITDFNICPRYTYRILDNIKICSSPDWLKERLQKVGIRPINNIVDVTNYIMLDMGQPLHAFDFDKIKNSKMTLRSAKRGEEITTIDNNIHQLNDNDIVIQDGEKLIDLAGIMGGKISEISNETRTIVLQAAIFNPVLIRKTSKKLGLQTEASYRYERNVDFNATILALEKATNLICQTTNCHVSQIYDFKKTNWQNINISWKPINEIQRYLGINISFNEIIKCLQKLGLDCSECQSEENCTISIPSYRHDLNISQDLIEEVARLYGYEKIKEKVIKSNGENIHYSDWVIGQNIRKYLAELGLTEIKSYPFISKIEIQNLGLKLENFLEVKNPISPENQYLRQDLIVSTLKCFAKNPWAPEIRIFEIGSCVTREKEFTQLVIALSDNNDKKLVEVLNSLKNDLKISKFDYEIIRIEQNILEKFKIRKPVILALINYCQIASEVINNNPKFKFSNKISDTIYKKISKFPPTIRDLAFIIDKKINGLNLISDIKNISNKILLVELFDEFENIKFGKNLKNVAYHIWFQDDKPINEKEINITIDKIINEIEKKYNAKIRK